MARTEKILPLPNHTFIDMKQKLIQLLEELKPKTSFPADVERAFRKLQRSDTYTREDGETEHFCSFIVPIHKASGSVFVGHHIKADDWIPPGGHIEPNEDPLETVIRECGEELQYIPTPEQIKVFEFTIIPIVPPRETCTAHFDFWFAVDVPDKIPFKYDRGEFHDAGWFTFEEAQAKLSRHRQYYNPILSMLHTLYP